MASGKNLHEHAAVVSIERACVLVFAGSDPSGGAGIAADIQAIAGVGAHALPVVTVLTAQDNNRVHAIQAVTAAMVTTQAEAVIGAIPVAAVKIGLVGSRDNAGAIVRLLRRLRAENPALPVVLDPVLASGHGDALTVDDAISTLTPLLPYVTVITPNVPEAALLYAALNRCQPSMQESAAGQASLSQARCFFKQGIAHVLLKGGHGNGDLVVNRWWANDDTTREWTWPRLPDDYHGSGCTLAAGIAGKLAQGMGIGEAIDQGQRFCQQALAEAFAIAPGQKIPSRTVIAPSN